MISGVIYKLTTRRIAQKYSKTTASFGEINKKKTRIETEHITKASILFRWTSVSLKKVRLD